MPDLYTPEDEAALYVLGELTAAERREFEARLAQSAELRALVREVEEGAVALSMASPRRRPPREAWTRIEKAVRGETRRQAVFPVFWVGWWRHGWAAAAACLVGWLLYALWPHRPGPSDASPVPVVTGVNSPPGATLADTHQDNTRNRTRQDNAENNAAFQLLQARTQEIGALRWQIAELTNRMAHLSQALTQQQALLSESSRLKFFQLSPPSAGSNGAISAPVSPGLQRALLLAMTRELGWTSSGASSEVGGTESARTNHAGVDFVDLRPGSNNVPASIGRSQVELEPAGAPESSALASASSNAIPGFVSGTSAVLAFDSSVVPTGSSLTFWTATSWGQFQNLGTVVLGNYPMVVTMPFAVTTWEGGNVTVVAATANGPSNVIGQFSTQGTISP